MKAIFQTRFLFWKRHWKSLLFWLVFPFVVTWFLIVQFATLQADTKVPVGIVLEEDTELVQDVVASLEDTPHIRPVILSEKEALNQLQKHELDSVFIFRNRYEESIERGSRNQLVKSYQSDMSFAYTPLRETVISYVQQDYSRAKTAFVVQRMGEAYGVEDIWSFDELITRSKEIVQEQKLLEVDFSFANDASSKGEESSSLLKTWHVWALFSMLATFMVFDWVIKEKRSAVAPRFTFGRYSLKQYLLLNMILYTSLLFAVDLLTMVLFKYVLQEAITIKLMFTLLSYRLLLTICIFIFSNWFKSTYMYYTMAFAIVLFVTLMSGALIPVEGVKAKFAWFNYINPLEVFLTSTYLSVWHVAGFVLLVLWYVWKGESDA